MLSELPTGNFAGFDFGPSEDLIRPSFVYGWRSLTNKHPMIPPSILATIRYPLADCNLFGGRMICDADVGHILSEMIEGS